MAGDNSNSARARFWRTVLDAPRATKSSIAKCEPRQSSPSPSPGHSRRKPFVCDAGCEQKFSQRSHLNQHRRTVHQGLKPFACESCERSFGKKFDLSSHQSAVHKNLRPHVCAVCEKAFAKKSNLVRHHKKLHP